MTEGHGPTFEKQVTRLPDGRQLIHYRFPGAPSRPEPRPEPARPPPGEATPKTTREP